MLVDSEDMSKVRFYFVSEDPCLKLHLYLMERIVICSQSFWANCTSMGGVSYKTESSPITPVKQSLVFLYGMFKPCANFVGITVFLHLYQAKNQSLSLLCYLSQKFFGHCVGLQGKGSYSQPQ